MTYIRTNTMRLLRVEHKVDIREGRVLLDILQDLRNIPTDARLTKIEEDDFCYYLIFEGEEQLPNPQKGEGDD